MIYLNLHQILERSIGGRAEALIGKQSKQLKRLEDLDEAFVKSKELIKQSPNTISSNWTLYAVDANEVEFWQGDSERKHIRVQYQRNDEKWKHHLLWP
ncbi:pyridoxine/pyridoxamine 5'-phosphate oxidase [Virgibacillus halotolerans]|nr:pyridoxine/pyridoxamine 5'-phosphate oxidase [Virgibacillus halotolerans]